MDPGDPISRLSDGVFCPPISRLRRIVNITWGFLGDRPDKKNKNGPLDLKDPPLVYRQSSFSGWIIRLVII
jgi:hypothetical protein